MDDTKYKTHKVFMIQLGSKRKCITFQIMREDNNIVDYEINAYRKFSFNGHKFHACCYFLLSREILEFILDNSRFFANRR